MNWTGHFVPELIAEKEANYPTLDRIFVKYNCDKGTLPDGVGHRYGKHYEAILEPLRDKPIHLLEIGVGEGKSIKSWLEYFANPDAVITGVDNSSCHELDSDKRYHFIRGDQTDASFLSYLATKGRWDVVIDDGSHTSSGIIPTFETLWPFVKPGGYYVIEDLRCSYMPGYQVNGWPGAMYFIRQLLDDINAQTDYKPSPDAVFAYPHGTDGGRGIEWMNFSEELCVLKKK